MTSNVGKEIQRARPSLRNISPVSFWFILLMGVFNMTIGGLFLSISSEPIEDPAFKAIVNFIPIWLWGVIFISLGAFKITTLHLNSWKYSRISLLMGVALKSGWALALIIKSIADHESMFLTTTWAAIAVTQVICYIYFLPPQEMRLFNGKKMRE